MSSILYDFGLTVNGDPIYIEQAQRGQTYLCSSCGCEMVVKLGNQRQHHFAHKVANDTSIQNKIDDCERTNESILHSKFKYGLYNYLCKKLNSDDKNFYVDYEPSNFGFEKRNILKVAGKIEVEKFLNPFRPDITIFDKQGKALLAIEIVVSHKPDRKKLIDYSNKGIYLLQITLNKNDFCYHSSISDDLIARIASKPTIFTFIQPPSYTKSICKECNNETYFSYLNINTVICPCCNKETRVAYISYNNKENKECTYYLSKDITKFEKQYMSLHGIEFTSNFCFICDNCEKEINPNKIPRTSYQEKLIKKKKYPLGFFCQKCHGQKRKFNSNLEKKWAKLFDENDIEYEYNKKEFRISIINPFPVFLLKKSNQLFRAYKAANYTEELIKAKILHNITGLDIVLGDDYGKCCLIDGDSFYAGDETNIKISKTSCNKCEILKYYNNNQLEKYHCKMCNYYIWSSEETMIAKCNSCGNWYFCNYSGSWECKKCGNNSNNPVICEDNLFEIFGNSEL